LDHKDYLILIGAPKCATTSLAAWMDSWPDTSTSAVKESLFFTDFADRHWTGPGADFVSTAVVGDEAFRAMFDPNAQLRVEASTDNLSCAVPAERIRAFADRPDVRSCRVVVVLRDPVERIISEFEHTLKLGWQRPNMMRSLRRESKRIAAGWHPLFRHLDRSRYAAQLRPYRDLFGDDLLILDYHDMAASEAKLLAFVGRDPKTVSARPEHLNVRHVTARPMAARLAGKSKLRKVARSFVPEAARTRIRAMIEGKQMERYKLRPLERDFILNALRQDIEACRADPMIPTENWTYAAG